MLKYYNYDIVFSEIPDEVTLAINISGCPNHCKGCHSPWLWDDIGEPLNEQSLTLLLEPYAPAVTCICFMGGDADSKEVEALAKYIHQQYPSLKTGWYSGRQELPASIDIHAFNYLKLGPYKESQGGLKSPVTNQRLYKIHSDGQKEQISLLQS